MTERLPVISALKEKCVVQTCHENIAVGQDWVALPSSSRGWCRGLRCSGNEKSGVPWRPSNEGFSVLSTVVQVPSLAWEFPRAAGLAKQQQLLIQRKRKPKTGLEMSQPQAVIVQRRGMRTSTGWGQVGNVTKRTGPQLLAGPHRGGSSPLGVALELTPPTLTPGVSRCCLGQRLLWDRQVRAQPLTQCRGLGCSSLPWLPAEPALRG